MSKKRDQKKRPHGRRARPVQVEAWLTEAERHIRDQAYESAVQVARRVLRHVPQGSKPYGEAQYYLEGSRQALSKALEVEPQNAGAWYNRGLSHRLLLRTGEALRDVERAVELEQNPRSREIYEEERAFLRKIVEGQLARRGPDYTLDQLIEEQQTFWRGVHLMEAEKWVEAEAAFRRVVEAGDVPPQPWGNLGACLIMQGRYDEAEEALKKALEIEPDYAVARRNLAMLPVVREQGPSAMRISPPFAGRELKQSILFTEHNASE
jgi:tetratricopeptide (TPR) repeat protein